MYQLLIYLDTNKPLPKIGDKFEIVSIEDTTECEYHRPCILATLESVPNNAEFETEHYIEPEDLLLTE
jgi:hypothetical protein